MAETKYKIIIDKNAKECDRRFAVELAHLIGFCSISAEFPLAICTEMGKNDGTRYFYIGANTPKDPEVIWVRPGENPAAEWKRIYDEILVCRERQIAPPPGYVSATGNSLAKKAPLREGGLELLFEKQWVLMDEDRDGLPDQVNCRMIFENPVDEQMCFAACNLAARLGMESTGVMYPLILEEDDGHSNLIRLRSTDKEPSLQLLSEQPRKQILIEGKGKKLEEFSNAFCSRFPVAGEDKRLDDVFAYLKDALMGKNRDGQAAYREAFGSRQKTMLVSADAELEKFQRKWPETQFHHYNDGVLQTEREYEIPWDREEVRNIFQKEILPKLNAGDEIEITCAVWQDRDERAQLAEELKNLAGTCGILAEISVICAYKQGLCWLEEVFAPCAARKGKVNRVKVKFDRHSDSALRFEHGADNVCSQEGRETYGAATDCSICRADWERIHAYVGKPPRWLQELYPADELVGEVLQIPRERITFEVLPEEADVTYEAIAFDADGKCLYRDTYTVPVCARPYLSMMPELGVSVHPTGFLRVKRKNEILTERQILSDGECIWNIFQEEILPWAHRLGLEKEYLCERQPFFLRMEMEIGIGGPERELSARADHISSGEVLEDSLHQVGQQSFLFYGRMKLGRKLDAPGLFLPRIHVRPGRPTMKAKLYLPYGEKPSVEPAKAAVFCQKVTLGEAGLELWAKAELSKERQALIPALLKLTREGFTRLSELLCGYGKLHINGWEAELPQKNKTGTPMVGKQIDFGGSELIGYDYYADLMNQLKKVPELKVYEAGVSYQGRTIYAIEPSDGRRGYVSRVKRIQYLPTVLVNGRHHSNEVSASNAILKIVKELVVGEKYRDLPEEMNLILVPMENVDGAALHYEIQKEHPQWQHQVCYTNSLGSDLMPNYYIENTIHTEAAVFADITKKMYPDAFLDLHGVPHHDISSQFGMLEGYRGLWLPQAMLCSFYFHIDDPRFASNKELSRAWKDRISEAYAQENWFAEANAEWKERFYKYSWNGIDSTYPSEWNGSMLNYWVPSSYDENHPYPTVRWPWIYSVMFTAEAADETAHGAWLEKCARAHEIHVEEGISLIRKCKSVFKENNFCRNGHAGVSMVRQRPFVAW